MSDIKLDKYGNIVPREIDVEKLLARARDAGADLEDEVADRHVATCEKHGIDRWSKRGRELLAKARRAYENRVSIRGLLVDAAGCAVTGISPFEDSEPPQ